LILHSKEKAKGGQDFIHRLVLSIAQKENVSFDELKSIKGTGLEGRVSKKDILAYIEKRKLVKFKFNVQSSRRIKKN
jgi:2-oxoglutarate dehydrogenase E2 component (dihydrolipoamide succinyltransferase)